MLRFTKASILFLGFFASAPGLAQNLGRMACPNFRLDQAGQSMERLPIYNQGSLNVCASYTASQMVDAYRFSRNSQARSSRKTTSPLSFAIMYSSRRVENGRPRPRATINGGNFSWIIETARSQPEGICEFQAVESHFARHPQAEENVEILHKLWSNHRTALSQRDQHQARVTEDAVRQYLQASGFTPAMMQRLGDLGGALNTSTSPQFLQNLLKAACRERSISLRNIPAPTTLEVHQSGNPGSSRESDFSLVLREMFASADPQPIAINYCADFLEDASSVRNLETNPDRQRPGAVGGCKMEHASVVIGSRERDGRCEFLIRNTWGRTCSNYDRRWECENNGQIWVDESALVRNTNQAGWLGGLAVPQH